MDKLEVFEYSLKNKRFGYLQDKLMEEMSELIQAFMKARERGKNHSEDIEKEFADVSLMMQQIRYCYDFKTDGVFSENVEIYEQVKCDKLWSIWHDGIIPKD
jgi:hypothetical protein